MSTIECERATKPVRQAAEANSAAIDTGHDMLLIGASFFGYLGKLIAALGARGRRPIWFEDRPGTDTVSKMLLRLAPKLLDGKVSAHVAEIVEKIRSHPIPRRPGHQGRGDLGGPSPHAAPTSPPSEVHAVSVG